MATQRRLSGAAMLTLPAAALSTIAFVSPATAKPPVIAGTAADMRVLTPLSGEVVGASFKLDLSFQSRLSSPIATAELYVDGIRWVRRALDKPQVKSILSFDVDSSTLTPGPHTVLVKVLTDDGAWSSAQLQVVTGPGSIGVGVEPTPAGAPELNFRSLGTNNRVAGIIEIEIDAPAKNGVSPYVTFYVDKQFKTLKNYPPYAFTWDTTTVENGYHTIEAMGYLESSNMTSTRRMQVYVDNAGGNTVRLREIPDLSDKTAPKRTVTLPAPRAARMATDAQIAAAPATAELRVSASGLAVVNAPSTARSAAIATPMAPKPSPRKPAIAEPVRVPAGVAEAVIHPLLRRSADASQLAVDNPGKTAPISPAGLAAIQAPANVLVTGAPASVAPAALRIRISLASTARTVTAVPHRETLHPLSLPDPSRGIQVAFDGQQIAFDVLPRVEKGLPIAPFRQIFEHTGGQVMWVPETRIVRAVSGEREVIIAVGKDSAQVNGESIRLERPAFIERGRTIVPLSFVGQALDVKISYDPVTGRLQISSN
jgi:hypothetical protein